MRPEYVLTIVIILLALPFVLRMGAAFVMAWFQEWRLIWRRISR